MIYKDLGIPLRASNVGEADKIFTILTENNGKIQAVAKGIRKMQSRKRGNIEVGTISSLSLYSGKTFDTITECEMKEFFPSLRSFEGIKFIYDVIKILDKFANTKETCNFLFDHTVKTMRVANDNLDKLEYILPWFRLRIAQFESTLPEFHEADDERFELLISIFLQKELKDVLGVKITETTLKRLENFSIRSLIV